MLNIAKKIYVGWLSTTGFPEATVIPSGDTTNEKKKIATFIKKYTTCKELNNTPLPGFTLLKSGRRSWSSSETTWSVIDPRGFIVTITSQNLEEILHVTGITEGLIQQRCVWAREDSQTRMTLVPVSADKYDLAVHNTKLLDDKVDMSEVQIGDTVSLQNGLNGKYMGVLSLYGRIAASTINDDALYYKASAKLRKQVIEISPGCYYFQTDVKILSIKNKCDIPMTKEESANIINKEIEDNNAFFTGNSWFPDPHQRSTYIKTHAGEIKFVSASAVPKPALTATEVSKDDVKKYFKKFTDEKDPSIVFERNNKHYIIDYPYWGDFTLDSFELEESLINFDPTNVGDCLTGNPSQNHYRHSKTKHHIDNFTKFYIITKHVKNSTYI